MLASGSYDRTVKLWRTDGTLLQTFEGHSGRIISVSFRSDGQMLASASADGTMKLWRIDGTLIQAFEGHKNSASSISFSPNEKKLALASPNGTVELWNLDLDDLLMRGCNWLHDYLKINPNVSQSDRHLWDDILPKNQQDS
jgi:WD40 repeat protein